MLSKKKISALLIFLCLFSILFFMDVKVEAENGSNPPYYVGDYEGDAAIIYFMEFWGGGGIFNDDNFTTIFPHNMTNSQSYVFPANSIEVRAYQLNNGTENRIIANNITNQKNISNSMKIAQAFSVDILCSIDTIYMWLNYSLTGTYKLWARIYEEDFVTIVDQYNYWISSSSYSGWRNFWFWNNIIQPNTTYYIVYEIENTTTVGASMDYGGNSTWKAELLNNSIYNKGPTLLFNGTSWNPIQNDTEMDMLCYFRIIKVLDPHQIDLKIYVDNELCTYQKRKAQWGGGYEAFYSSYFTMPPTTDINLTITTNVTVYSASIDAYMRYIYLIPAFGWFNATPDRIEWTIIYPNRYVDAWGMPGTMFAFEYDWDFVEFRNPAGDPVSNVYFGPISYYNSSYFALFTLFGPPPEPGNYTGTFTSPNYCHDIITKLKDDSVFQEVTSFELGQTIKLEALIEDSNSNPISGGNGTINFTSPSGQVVFSETNLSSINGILNTSEFYIDTGLETGLYTISVVWTNGIEVGYDCTQIEVKSKYNFCHDIFAKVKDDSVFQEVTSFELGQTIKLEALIEDSDNNPLSGGNGTINFTSPSGQVVFSETNLSSINGILNTSEFYIDTGLETGFYNITVSWTKGWRVGYYYAQIEVKLPPSPPPGPNWLLIGVLFALAIVSTPLAIYARRRIQTRNWEKHLRNLFVLSKDGRSIYGYTFGIEIQDPALISSALMAITTFVTTAVKSKKALRVIDLEDKKVLMNHGTHTIIALISEKNFPVIHNRVAQFTEAFEARYGKKVATWRGDMKIFKGTDELIEEYFPVSMEERITRGVKLKLIETQELLRSATEPELIISILRSVTQLLTRYRPIIEQYYMDDYAELIKAAEEKMGTI